MKNIAVLSLLLIGIVPASAQETLTVGNTVKNVSLKDGNDSEKTIPFLGEKVLTLFYTDPDVKDVNDPLSAALKKKSYPDSKYAGIGVGNCSDTWIPNSAIRYSARQKESQFKGAIILLDDNHVLKKSWRLGATDDAAVVIVVGKDKKIKYIKTVKSEDDSKTIVNDVLKAVDAEMQNTVVPPKG